MSERFTKNALLTLLLVVTGIAALYAYNSYDQKQAPVAEVPFATAVTEIGLGRVQTVEVTSGRNTALLMLRDGTKQQTVVGDQGGTLVKVVNEYNAANPDRPAAYVVRQETDAPQGLGQLLIAILPIVLIAALFLYVVLCSGMVALDPASGELVGGDIREQTRRTIANLDAVLRASGSDLHHVLKTTVYLTDINEFQQMNAVYAEAFGEHTPARATVEVGKLPRGARVEIECVALRSA